MTSYTLSVMLTHATSPRVGGFIGVFALCILPIVGDFCKAKLDLRTAGDVCPYIAIVTV